MGKNYKEQAVYDYIHNNGEIDPKILRKVKNKWRRRNCAIGESRHRKNQSKEQYYEISEE